MHCLAVIPAPRAQRTAENVELDESATVMAHLQPGRVAPGVSPSPRLRLPLFSPPCLPPSIRIGRAHPASASFLVPRIADSDLSGRECPFRR
jgi:hypothetical protein